MKKRIIFELSALFFVCITLAQSQVQLIPITQSGGYIIEKQQSGDYLDVITYYEPTYYSIGTQSWGPGSGGPLARTWRTIQYFDLRSIFLSRSSR